MKYQKEKEEFDKLYDFESLAKGKIKERTWKFIQNLLEKRDKEILTNMKLIDEKLDRCIQIIKDLK